MEQTNWILEWIYPLAPLVGVIIGAIVVAILTKARDHAAWLRNKRLETLSEFLRSADEYAAHVWTIDGWTVERANDLRFRFYALTLISQKPLTEVARTLFDFLNELPTANEAVTREQLEAFAKEVAQHLAHTHRVGRQHFVGMWWKVR